MLDPMSLCGGTFNAPAVPIIYGDGVHDDSAGLQALISGLPYSDPFGRVATDPEGQISIRNCEFFLGSTVYLDHRSIGAPPMEIAYCHFRTQPADPEADGRRHDADARAESLLRSWLTPEQLKQRINAVGVFTVRGGSTGRRYRLGYGSCYELDEDGQEVAHLCFGPTDFRLPLPDRVLAQKLALECDEEAVLRIANRTMTGLFSVAQTAVGEPCVIDTDRMANLVQAAARELQMQEGRRQRQLRILRNIARGIWALAAFVGFACYLRIIFN